jgi:hypothetical protein
MSREDLSYDEAADIDECWREIKEGKAKKFRTVDELLRELHGEAEK